MSCPGLFIQGDGCAAPGSNLPNSLQIYSWSANRRDPITTGCASMCVRIVTHENLFADFFLSSPTALWRNIFLLTLTALTKVFFTAWSFGMMVGVPHRISLLFLIETPRSPLEFSYRQSRSALAWGGLWDSSRKPQRCGYNGRFTDKI
jgi:hypothetical protein